MMPVPRTGGRVALTVIVPYPATSRIPKLCMHHIHQSRQSYGTIHRCYCLILARPNHRLQQPASGAFNRVSFQRAGPHLLFEKSLGRDKREAMTCDSMAEAPALSKCSLQRQPLSFRDCSHRGAALRHIAWQAKASNSHLCSCMLVTFQDSVS